MLLYETVFEPFSLKFAQAAIAALGDVCKRRVIDVAAGAGGAALELARRGASVTAVDASAGMVARIAERARVDRLDVDARVMDGVNLAFPAAHFDAGLSVFGIILFEDAVGGLRELARTVKPGGRIAIVTWTEPHRFELAMGLRRSAEAVAGPLPPSSLPAQLRFIEGEQFRALFHAAGLPDAEIVAHSSTLNAPSADWLIERLAFAPGMGAMLAGLGDQRPAVLEHYREHLNARFGGGPVVLEGVAAIAAATV